MKYHPFSAILACAALTCTAYAADLTWDGDSTAGITNGSAAWDAANVWFDGSSNVSFTADDNVTFTATGSQSYSVSTGATGPYSVGNMTFDSTSDSTTGVRLNSPAIVLSGVVSTAVGHTGLVDILGVISGNGSFTLGSGEMRLTSNSNTFSGGITLNGGTLRVGTAAGAGNPQASGSLGIGTFTLNGGTIFQNQGNVRLQAVPAVIGGNFSFNSALNGGLIVGGNSGSTVSIGDAVRTISVSQNSDGTGANSYFGLNNLVGGAASGIIKNGAGFLTLESRKTDENFNFNGTLTVNAGELRLAAAGGANATNSTTGDIGVTAINMASGTTLRIISNEVVNRAAVLTLSGADFAGRDSLNTSRRTGIGTLQVTGTARVDFGTGLLIAASGSAGVSEIRVATDGVLGGNGTLRSGTSSFSAGVTSWSSEADATVSLRATGFLSPGTPAALNSSIATLSTGSLVWQGSASAAPMKFNLGSSNQSDRLALSGNFGRDGSTLVHQFDFLGTGEPGQTYTLVTFATMDSVGGAAVFDPTMFAATNLASGVTGSFSLNANSLTFTTDGEGGGSPFEEWVGGPPYNLTGDDALPGGDPDGDGVFNLLEYALNGNPTSGSDNGKQFVKMATVDSVPNVLTLTIAVRSGAIFAASGNRQSATVDQIIYTIEASNNLADWGTPVVTEVPGADATAIQAGLPALSSGWSYRTFRSDGSASGDTADFMRLKVEEAP
jgi:autotransporter-associated beta strand protein